MSASTAAHTPFDPYSSAPRSIPLRFLPRLNPLAKLAGTVPAMLLLIAVRDFATPVVFIALAYAIIIVGVPMSARVAVILAVAIPLGFGAIGLGFSIWVDASRVDHSFIAWQLGGWTMYGGALAVGFATAARIAAIVALSLVTGLSTTGADLVRASVQQLRVPYRVGYTALAAFRFVPRFRTELEVIRAAHRVRGSGRGRGPVAAVGRWVGYLIPLLAGAIRHAERVALAMDARAFGAHPTRTERYRVPFRTRDTVFLVLSLAVSAAVFWWFFPWQPA